MFKIVPSLVYGTYMATVDVFMLGLLKAMNLGWISHTFILLPTLIYGMLPWVFMASLKYETLTVMNLLHDLLSDIFVTLTGLFFFKEYVSRTKMVGVGLSFIAILFLTYPGDLI